MVGMIYCGASITASLQRTSPPQRGDFQEGTLDYSAFIQSKNNRHEPAGFEPAEVNPAAFDWQAEVIRWACRIGRAALFEDCGLGKTLQQLEWLRQVVDHTGGPTLLLCPLAVQRQTLREAERFSIQADVRICERQSDVGGGINIANYEKLHLFDAETFSGVALDESSILKAYTGKTKQTLIRAFESTPYKLACTATPAPNDRMELGNHCEFLGVMPSNEMLCRWFINAGDKVGAYRLRRHGEKDFWNWVASWAICMASPADIGFDASGYDLPPLVTHEHVCRSPTRDGWLFNTGVNISATEVHQEKRQSLDERADVVAELVTSDREPWAVWVDTNYEADAICKRIPDAVEVRGSHSAEIKSARLESFSDGSARVIVTKPEIGGFGLNWQHCNRTTWFAGYSYERFYQSIRRLLRFGQLRPVHVHIVRSENEQSIVEEIERKERQHKEMQSEMAALMGDSMRANIGRRQLAKYAPAMSTGATLLKTKGMNHVHNVH